MVSAIRSITFYQRNSRGSIPWPSLPWICAGRGIMRPTNYGAIFPYEDMNENYQIAVIGTGSGGSEAAILAAKKGFKVVVIENGALGGTRLHHGSYAVRALHAAARLHGEFFKGKKAGVDVDLFTESLVQWKKAQRAASSRLAGAL